MKKYFICFKPKKELYLYLKDLSQKIKKYNPELTALYEEELLHLTLHKPIVGDYKDLLSDFVDQIAQDFSKTKIILEGFAMFNDNLVLRVHATYNIALLWVKVREYIEKMSNELGNGEDMLHFTLFKNIPKRKHVNCPEDIDTEPFFENKEYPFEYICLFEKEPNGKWVEIKRALIT